MRHTVVFTLRGAPAAAVAVEWTDQAAPLDSAEGWQACVRTPEGGWRLASHGVGPDHEDHWRAPGPFAGLALRYRLSPAGAWSPISADRKEIEIVPVADPEAVPAALAEADWSAPERVALEGGGLTAAVTLLDRAAEAAGLEWTTGADGVWRPCVALGAGRWRFADFGAETAHLLAGDAGLDGIALRRRLVAGGRWSPISEDRKALPPQETGGRPVAPIVLLAPVLMGTGKIGDAVTVSPGLWGGVPVPDLRCQWLRDGVEIDGASDTLYTPGPSDDLTALSCRVTAVNPVGAVPVVTASLAITHVAPEARGTIPEEVFDEGTGLQTVAAGGYFTGQALRFSMTGAGAQIDPETGVIGISTDMPLAGETLRVAAANSGGSAIQSFEVTVEAAEEPLERPVPLLAAQWSVETVLDPVLPGAPLVGMIRILAGPALGASRVYRTSLDPTDAFYPGYGFEICTPHPDAARYPDCWIWRSNNPTKAFHVLTDKVGEDLSTVLRYSLDDAGAVALDQAVFSDDSDRKVWRVRDVATPVEPKDPPAGAPGEFRIAPVFTRAEHDAGALPGDNGQYMLAVAQCAARPNVFFMAQDMGAVWVTLDHGRSWNNLRNRGLHSVFMVGLACDPLDHRRLFGITGAGARWDDPDLAPGSLDNMGLYRSVDGGLNWTRMVPNDVNIGRGRFNTICHAPASTNARLGYATRWYCILQKPPGNHEFWISDDAGDSWRKVRELAYATYGNPSRLVGHPTEPGVVYLYGGKGIWRFDAADKSGGAITPLSGAGGLPSGSVAGTIYVGRDGRTMIVGVAGRGVYRSVDGGSRWTQLSSESRGLNLFVNPWNPERMVKMFGKNGGQIEYSTDGGTSFTRASRSAQVPGEGSGDAPIDENYGHAQWLPDDPDRIWVHGRARNHQSDDGGRTWRPSNAYFNGKQFTNWCADQMFDPKDMNRFAYFMVDYGCAYTTNRGRWFSRAGLVGPALGLTHSTVNGGAIHPDASNGVILLSMGKSNKGALCLSRDNGASWTLPMGTTERRYQYIGFDVTDPRYAYANRFRSTDNGVTWSVMSSLPNNWAVWGMTFGAANGANGQVLFAVDVDLTHGRVMRSTDRGATWRLVLENTPGFGLPVSKGGPFRCHPNDPDVLFTRGPNGHTIRKWDLSRGSAGARPFVDLNVMEAYGGTPPDGRCVLGSIAIDRRYPDVIYALNYEDNTPYVLFRSENGGTTWTNITEGFPAILHGGMEVSPVTGELFISGGNGSRIRNPPYAQASLEKDLPDWDYRYFDAPY